MNIYEYAKTLLFSPRLEDKLLDKSFLSDKSFYSFAPETDLTPGRDSQIDFSQKRVKFPKKDSFHQDSKRALALHFFANHELLAIEMMAAFILRFPARNANEHRLIRSICSTIFDEQKHFKLYVKRMRELGVEFGDYPLNNFFWNYFEKIDKPEQFFAVMSLTFEAANLDFSLFYSNLFREVEDITTAKILDIVFEDEIKHVELGVSTLRNNLASANKTRESKDLWDYYNELLPEGLDAARSKGIIFDEFSRKKAGFFSEDIMKWKNYTGDFKVTQRKQWKRPKKS